MFKHQMGTLGGLQVGILCNKGKKYDCVENLSLNGARMSGGKPRKKVWKDALACLNGARMRSGNKPRLKKNVEGYTCVFY